MFGVESQLYEKKLRLVDWISNMDEPFVDQLLKEYILEKPPLKNIESITKEEVSHVIRNIFEFQDFDDESIEIGEDAYFCSKMTGDLKTQFIVKFDLYIPDGIFEITENYYASNGYVMEFPPASQIMKYIEWLKENNYQIWE